MSINEALQLVDDMKKRGVLEFTFEGLSIRFDQASLHMGQEAAFTPPALTPKQQAELERNPKIDVNEADQDLYWSV